MDTSSIIAIIGALAWLPQIIQWISNYLKKPRLQVISATTCMLGLDMYGPTIHLTASVSSEKKDAIITRIEAILRHESGEERQFEWMSVSETQFNIQSLTSADQAMFVKNLKVLAIKAVQETLIERSIFFRDDLLAKKVVNKINSVKDNLKYLASSNSKPSNQIIKSKDYKELEHSLTENIFWREGNYTIDMSFEIKNVKSPHKQAFSFEVTRQDIEALKKNTDLIKRQVYQMITGESTDEEISWQFAWVQIR